MSSADVSPLADHYAEYALVGVNTMPWGTPASETPWCQKAGWEIRAAAERTTAYAIEAAMPDDWAASRATPAEQTALREWLA